MSAPKNLIGGKYRRVKAIGMGSFGKIYRGLNVEDASSVAIKMESRMEQRQQLLYEAKVYKTLGTISGVPKIYHFGAEKDHNVIVMQLLGPSLEDLFNLCNRHFSLKTVLMLSCQMLARVESVHRARFIHRDIKPENFLMGLGDNEKKLYLVDFGLAKRYFHTHCNAHISFRTDRSLTGTVRYASINAHLGYEQSRRDDLESMGYCMMYFNMGKLPWQGLKSNAVKQKYEQILEMKTSICIEELCKGWPAEFAAFLSYCRNLGFEQNPDYDYLRQLFVMLFKNMKYQNDYLYDWTVMQQQSDSATVVAVTAPQAESVPYDDEQTESEPASEANVEVDK